MQMINAGERLIVNNCSFGYLSHRIVFYLTNLHIKSRHTYFARVSTTFQLPLHGVGKGSIYWFMIGIPRRVSRRKQLTSLILLCQNKVKNMQPRWPNACYGIGRRKSRRCLTGESKTMNWSHWPYGHLQDVEQSKPPNTCTRAVTRCGRGRKWVNSTRAFARVWARRESA